MFTFLTIFGLFVGAVGIGTGSTPSEIFDYWCGAIENMWFFAKKLVRLIFRRQNND